MASPATPDEENDVVTLPTFLCVVACFLGFALAVRAAERLTQRPRLRLWR